MKTQFRLQLFPQMPAPRLGCYLLISVDPPRQPTEGLQKASCELGLGPEELCNPDRQILVWRPSLLTNRWWLRYNGIRVIVYTLLTPVSFLL